MHFATSMAFGKSPYNSKKVKFLKKMPLEHDASGIFYNLAMNNQTQIFLSHLMFN